MSCFWQSTVLTVTSTGVLRRKRKMRFALLLRLVFQQELRFADQRTGPSCALQSASESQRPKRQGSSKTVGALIRQVCDEVDFLLWPDVAL